MDTIVSLLQAWGYNRPVDARCKLLEKADMTGWDENQMWIIKYCGDENRPHT